MPSFSKVLSNTLSSIWESVSDVGRNLHFSFTVRNNAAKGLAQTNTDEMMVTIDATKGPFEVTSQNSTDTSWSALSWQTITWAVNNTVNLPGSSNVNIKLSVDGGLTFSTTLKANTPNDGSETIIVPNGITGKNCRILIEPTANIYFAINKEPFAIGYTTKSICETYNFSMPLPIPESNLYATSTTAVPTTTGIVSNVNVAVDFEHTYLSDVQLEIVNPQGNTVRLFEKVCGDTNGNLILNFDDVGGSILCRKQSLQTVNPYEPLIIFNETNPTGTWVFRARDRITGDIGKVNSASVTICTKEYTPINEVAVDLKEVLVYPNPTKGEFSVLFSSKFTSGVTILVHDLLGRKIYENNFPSTPLFNKTIQLSGVFAGIYLLKIIDSENITVKKITIN
jgi:subtilisin-like proprotein convertase family protein